MRPETFLALAAQQGVRLPFDAATAAQRVQVDGSEKTLVDYLDKIAVNYPVLKNAEALRRAAFEAAEMAHEDGVIYFELRAGPALHTAPGLPIEGCIEAMLAGLQEAQARYGIVSGLIVAGLRNHDPKLNAALAQAACKYQGQGVVGFDLAGDEAGYPAESAPRGVRAGAGSRAAVHGARGRGLRRGERALRGRRAGRRADRPRRAQRGVAGGDGAAARAAGAAGGLPHQ